MSPRLRLSAANLSALPANVARPAYDRSALSTGIVHLGIGSFHRAHQAVYTDSVLAGGDLRWGIVGASLRSPDTRDALKAQDYLYTLNLRAEAEALRVIGSLQDILVAPENPAALVETLCRPSVTVASLTVTRRHGCLPLSISVGSTTPNKPDQAASALSGAPPDSGAGSGEWRATADESGHYSFAVAL